MPGVTSGCRGPDKIWPGRGGIDGAIVGRTGNDGGFASGAFAAGGGVDGAVAIGGRIGFPEASGGRKGAIVVFGASLAGSGGGGGSAAAGVEVVDGAAAAGFSVERVAGGVFASGSAALAAGRGGSSTIGGGAGAPPLLSRRRISRATSSSMELECVFLSVTPRSLRASMTKLGLTSSSRASSLIRILLIFGEKTKTSVRSHDDCGANRYCPFCHGNRLGFHSDAALFAFGGLFLGRFDSRLGFGLDNGFRFDRRFFRRSRFGF